MSRRYNFIYSKLVNSQDDVVGHIAYSLYKADKVAYIEEYKNNNGGAEPTEEELERFHKSCTVSGQLERYNLQAKVILQTFTSETLDRAIVDIQNSLLEKQASHLREIIKPLVPTWSRSLWWNVLAGFIGSFVLALLAATFGFIKLYGQ